MTPDSFSDGGKVTSIAHGVRYAAAQVAAGAGIIDIGGESSRPGAQPVGSDEQMRRILPVIEAIMAQRWPVALSVDTSDSRVAAAAIDRGVCIINDISGLRDPRMVALVARTGCYAIIMHMRGVPRTMQTPEHLAYVDLIAEVVEELARQLAHAQAHGVANDKLWVDPGLGFAKRATHNWQLTKHLSRLSVLGRPLVYGASRKAFLGAAVTGPDEPCRRDAATAAICTAAVAAGAQVVRVHNVAAVRDAVKVGWALRHADE